MCSVNYNVSFHRRRYCISYKRQPHLFPLFIVIEIAVSKIGSVYTAILIISTILEVHILYFPRFRLWPIIHIHIIRRITEWHTAGY